MSEKNINVKVFRYDPIGDKEPYYQDFEVPFVEGMSAMDALDYIYQNLDSTLAYYDHAGCSLGICCLLYTSPSPRDRTRSRMPSSA